MSSAITSIGSGTLKLASPSTTTNASTGSGFTDALKGSLGHLLEGVEDTESRANEAVSNMVNKTGEVHDAMIALQQAQMQLEFTVAVRNKLVSAYQEIMRMPV
jgi:flagellar hook-basal body complex protein FliE